MPKLKAKNVNSNFPILFHITFLISQTEEQCEENQKLQLNNMIETEETELINYVRICNRQLQTFVLVVLRMQRQAQIEKKKCCVNT